jgi:N-acetyl sugar amidotransferase
MHKPTGYQVCIRCVMDTTDPDIEFDDEGICSHCYNYDTISHRPPHSLSPQERKKEQQKIIDRIKREGKGKPYDCVIGLSGGVDSSYIAYLTKKEFGLRPLAIHLDNGWDSELAIQNIEQLCKRLEIDLQTYVIDWEEFRDIQLAFLYASTPDSEIPSDHAIFTMWRQIPAHTGVRFFLSGVNFATESGGADAWSQGHGDWEYIRSVHRAFGHHKIKTFPHYGRLKLFYWDLIKQISVINILDFVHYNKAEAKKTLINEVGWRDYGGKHYESIYTKFFQAYILPKKFGYDKRLEHLTCLIHSGQITREEALNELQKPIYDKQELKEDMQYVLNNLRISEVEFQKIMHLPKKTINDYQSNKDVVLYRVYDHLFRPIIYTSYRLLRNLRSPFRKIYPVKN